MRATHRRREWSDRAGLGAALFAAAATGRAEAFSHALGPDARVVVDAGGCVHAVVVAESRACAVSRVWVVASRDKLAGWR